MQKFQPALELLRLKTRAEIKNAFCDEDPNMNIDLENFRSSLNLKLDLDLEETDTRNLFYQIDPYCNGSISYKSIVNYMENYEDRRLLTDEAPFHPIPSLYSGTRLKDTIFEWTVCPEQSDSSDNGGGHYVSLSRSGLLSFWRRDLTIHFEATIAVAEDGAKMTTMATGLVYIPKYKMVAVSTTDADIRFFRVSSYEFGHKFSIVWLPTVVVNMDCYDSEKLICGDFNGSVFLVHLDASFFIRLRRRADHLQPQKIPFDQLQKGRMMGLTLECTAKSHFSNVIKVKYIPSIRTVISCSVNSRRAMLVHHLGHNKSYGYYSEGGVTCFDFCEKLNCIATGCMDNSVKIWNPSFNSSCNETLTGHFNCVTHVLVDDKRLFLISADRDKMIRVWDLLRPRCLQVIKFKESDFAGRRIFDALHLDNENGKLIITTNQVAVLNLRQSDGRLKTHPHSELIIMIAYNTVFDCLITVGNTSSVTIWNPELCSLIYEFTEAHIITSKEGIPQIVDITAAGLDPSERRLITADRNGSIKVWNFHLGLSLQRFKAKFSILTLSIVDFEIYAGGSSGSISVFHDSNQDPGKDLEENKEWKAMHQGAVVSTDCYSSTLLASASTDGKIVVCLRKNEEAKLCIEDSAGGDEEAQEDDNYPAKRVVEKRRQCSINQILFLQTRKMDPSVGNLVSCGADGRIRFWNVNYANKLDKWNLISKFRAVFRDCDAVLCMTTDRNNNILITGDTMGFIRIYELEDYHSSYGSLPSPIGKPKPHQLSQFPFLRLQQCVQENHSQYSKFPAGGETEFGNAPLLLNCFRTHMGAILKVAYSNERSMVATAVREGSVRLWTIAGTYIGLLSPGDAEVPKTRTGHMPTDIRSTASALTLYVMNGGKMPYWRRALQALKGCRLGNVPEPTKEMPFRWLQKKEDIETKDLSEDFTLYQDLEGRLPQFPGVTGTQTTNT